MLLRDECLDESYVKQFDNPFEKLYVITIIVFLLAVRKLNGWNDIDEIEILKMNWILLQKFSARRRRRNIFCDRMLQFGRGNRFVHKLYCFRKTCKC